MEQMLSTYEIALKIMRFFDNYDPFGLGSDEFQDAFNGTVDLLLDGCKQDLIDQLHGLNLEPGDMYYSDAMALIEDLEKFETPDVWWKD